MPNDNAGSTHISLRVPNDLIQAFDKLAAVLDRPRSWVMLRALRQYLEDEGAEIAEDTRRRPGTQPHTGTNAMSSQRSNYRCPSKLALTF